MSAPEGTSSRQAGEAKIGLTAPTAIVIAGALIAAAIFFQDKALSLIKPAAVKPAVSAPVAAEPQEEVGEIRPVSNEDYIRGAANARVTLIEYSDLECPFCKRVHPTMQKIVADYPNDVRWVYRHFPLEQLHSKAKKEAEAVECAREQGKGWEMIDKIYDVTPSNNGLDAAQLPILAQQVGVQNMQQFNTCLSSGKYAQRVADDIADAQAAGGTGTPYSVIIGPDGSKTPVSGAQPYESFTAVINPLLGR